MTSKKSTFFKESSQAAITKNYYRYIACFLGHQMLNTSSLKYCHFFTIKYGHIDKYLRKNRLFLKKAAKLLLPKIIIGISPVF